MRPGKDIIGKRIYSVDKGDHLGSVKDLYFDAGLNSVVALYLGSEGLLSRKAKLIKLEHVIIMGNDVVLVDISDSVSNDKDVREAEHWIRRDEITGRYISTPGGTRVGELGDVFVGPNSQITGLKLSHIQIIARAMRSKKPISSFRYAIIPPINRYAHPCHFRYPCQFYCP